MTYANCVLFSYLTRGWLKSSLRGVSSPESDKALYDDSSSAGSTTLATAGSLSKTVRRPSHRSR